MTAGGPRRRRRTRRQWLLGVLALAVTAVLGYQLIRLAAATRGLTVELPDDLTLVPAAAGLPRAVVVAPDRVRDRFRIDLDGRSVPLSVAGPGGTADPDAFVVRPAFPELAPGFHLLELRPGYARRSAALGFVAGPFAEPDAWVRRGLHVHVRQDLLACLERPLAELVRQAVIARMELEPAEAARVHALLSLRLSPRGVDVGGEVRMPDGTRVVYDARLGVTVDRQHRFRFTRLERVDARVEGAARGKGRLLTGAGTGAAGGAVFGPWGAAIGALAGLIGGGKVVDVIAEHDLNGLLDRRLDDLEQALFDYPGLTVADGVRLELRPSAPPMLAPDELLVLGLDLRLSADRSAAAAPAPGAVSSGRPAPLYRALPGPHGMVTVRVRIDALNHILHGLWRAGLAERWLTRDAVLAGLRRPLAATNYELEAVALAAPPVVAATAPGGTEPSVVLPHVAVTLNERTVAGRGSGGRRHARFAAAAAIRATTSLDDRRVVVNLRQPRAWSACAEPRPPSAVAVSPCFMELLALARGTLQEKAKQPVASFHLDSFELVPAAAFAIRLQRVAATLHGGESPELTVAVDIAAD